MVSQSYLIRLVAAAAIVNALPMPLNINLGAYSPALVVGDGAIEFAAGQSAETILNSLEGAAVTSATTAAAGTTTTAGRKAQVDPAEVAQAPAPVEAAVAPGILSEKAGFPIPGNRKEIDPRDETEGAPAAKVEKRQTGFDRALTFAEAALTKGPKINLGTGEAGSGVGILVDNNQAVAARPGTGA